MKHWVIIIFSITIGNLEWFLQLINLCLTFYWWRDLLLASVIFLVTPILWYFVILLFYGCQSRAIQGRGYFKYTLVCLLYSLLMCVRLVPYLDFVCKFVKKRLHLKYTEEGMKMFNLENLFRISLMVELFLFSFPFCVIILS